MTPLVDVVFLLLIFFVCTAQFRPPEQNLPAELTAPQAAGLDQPTEPQLDELDEIVLFVRREGDRPVWLLGLPGQQVGQRRLATLDELKSTLSELAQIRRDLPVYIYPAPDVPVQDVVTTVDTCRHTPLSAISLVTKPRQP